MHDLLIRKIKLFINKATPSAPVWRPKEEERKPPGLSVEETVGLINPRGPLSSPSDIVGDFERAKAVGNKVAGNLFTKPN